MEKNLWKTEEEFFARGISVVAGTDEAGRGPLAGPVFAAAVVLPRGIDLPGLNDSKKLTPKKRDKLYDMIVSAALCCCVASASVEEIERLNILEAALLAMRRAVEGLSLRPQCLLVDGNICRGFDIPAYAIVGGDGLSASIAAASILAKVSRDRHMLALAEKYPGYGFEKHKGYGTRQHIEAVSKLGVCPEHRRSFLRNIRY